MVQNKTKFYKWAAVLIAIALITYSNFALVKKAKNKKIKEELLWV